MHEYFTHCPASFSLRSLDLGLISLGLCEYEAHSLEFYCLHNVIPTPIYVLVLEASLQGRAKFSLLLLCSDQGDLKFMLR